MSREICFLSKNPGEKLATWERKKQKCLDTLLCTRYFHPLFPTIFIISYKISIKMSTFRDEGMKAEINENYS